MKPGARKVLIVLAAAGAFLVVSWAAIIGAILTVGGVATVQLRDHAEGFDLYLPVPMAVVSTAATTAGLLAPWGGEQLRVHGDVDLGDWAPFVEALMEGLEDCPDTTFVEVIDRGELVRVAKRGGKLRVEVDNPELTLRVEVPVRPVRRAVAGLLR